MHSYLIINHTYNTFELALFINDQLCDQRSEDKRLASKQLIPLINDILVCQNISISELSFIGINQGPGLFSTLRSILATANGLHLATQVPLIGIDGLDATVSEFYNQHLYTVALLDAFNSEVYYAIAVNGKTIFKGYSKIESFLDTINKQYNTEKVYFIGNAVSIYQNLIKEKFSSNALIPEIIPQVCSLSMIAQLSQEKFLINNYTRDYLLPLHLKKHAVEMI